MAEPVEPVEVKRPTAPKSRDALLREAIWAYVIATAVSVAFFQLGRAVPFVGSNLHALIAATFLYVPATILWRQGLDFADAGFVMPRGKQTAVLIAVFFLVIIPIFSFGMGGFYHLACLHAPWLTPPGTCPAFRGAGTLLTRVRFPGDFAQQALAEVVVVAVPEEFFFRGYLHARLEQVWPARHKLWGGGVGLALVVSSALFALAHLVIQFNPLSLAVFFPGLLFGWMRSATGSIFAGATTHATANLLMKVLAMTYFRR